MTPLTLEKKFAGFSFLFLSAFCFTLSKTGHWYDVGCFSEWGKFIYNYGLSRIYETNTDYLPLYHYFVHVFTLTQNTANDVVNNFHYFKVFSLVFHLITGYFILKFFVSAGNSEENAIYKSLFYILNLAVLYNCLIWNQVDIILTTFVFMSVYFAVKQKTLISLILLLLALNFKLHAIIFIPIIGLIVLPAIIKSLRTGKFFIGLFILALLQYLILLPYILNGNINRVLEVIFASVDKHPFISYYAYNIWYLLVPGPLHEINDTALFMNTTYKSWGLIIFFITSALALIPLIKDCYFRILRENASTYSVEQILLTCSLIPLLFFYFNTQMHERYSHPALVFLITYCCLQKKTSATVVGVIGCAAYLLNLEHEMRFLDLPNYDTLIFEPVFISLLYLTAIVVLFYFLFTHQLVSLKQRKNNQIRI